MNLLWLLIVSLCLAFSAQAGPAFDEVYQVLKTNLPGMTETDLDQAAIQGLVAKLAPKVLLVKAETAPGATAKPLGKVTLYDEGYAYFRVGRVVTGLETQLMAELQKIRADKKLRGVLLDLRFAEGSDYRAAAAVADFFVPGKQNLLDWGEGAVESRESKEDVLLPVVILMNQETKGSAEALASILREHLTALLVGSRTAGQASMAKEIALKNGEKLRIATTPIKVNGRELTLQGLEPDVPVAVKPEAELAFWEDPYKTLEDEPPTSEAARINRLNRRTNEAELVRRHREGQDPDSEPVSNASSSATAVAPSIKDPVLVRGLDLLKGLAVLHPRKNP